uniref:Uncharacterized protein n=1 Tax=Triticum urartu TaxID=4572 RepID=A0A8R7QQ69_TRIUA
MCAHACSNCCTGGRAGAVLPPAGRLPAAAGGGHGGGALEPRGRAGDGDPAGVLEAELLLGLAQQLPEERVVEVHHRHHVPHRLPAGLVAAHVHRHLPLGRRRLAGLLQQPLAAPRQEPHPPRQRPPPPQHPPGLVPLPLPRQHHQLLLLLLGAPDGRVGRLCASSQLAPLQAGVAASPAVAERPAPEPEQLPAEPESSLPPCHHATAGRSKVSAFLC